MGSVIMDATSRGLIEASQNADPALVTLGVDAQMKRWYKGKYKPRVLRIIASGSPRSRIPRNQGRYRFNKLREHGIDHGLGRLTHTLYEGVKAAPWRTTVTRGREVRLAVIYKSPYYISYVHDGTSKSLARPFVEVARDDTLPGLMRQLEGMFDGLDLTDPPPKVMSSVIGHIVE